MPPDGHADRRDDESSAGQTARPLAPTPRPAAARSATTTCAWQFPGRVRLSPASRRPRSRTHPTRGMSAWTESHWMWSEYQRKWPPEDRPPADRSDDDPDVSARVEAACDRIADLERDKITPAMRTIESQDPDRHLIGFDDRLKDPDRIKEKVHDTMEEVTALLRMLFRMVPDTIRYTFQYRESHYTQGVWADIGRLKDQGFELHKVKNAWSGEHYKGINSQWIEPDSGQRFEVQFHTRISFEAKQLTHDAYERLRTHQADKFEELVLEAFQRKDRRGGACPARRRRYSRLPVGRRRCQIRSRTTPS